MCTAVSYNNSLFGRTFDYHKSYGERIIITPRDYYQIGETKNRYAMIGVGVLAGDEPLYFDGMNEWGLFCAALNFSGFANYGKTEGKRAVISSSHLIGFLLGLCRSVNEVRDVVANLGISTEGPGGGIKPTSLHWMVCDRRSCIVIEPLGEGLRVFDNPFGVLTNGPDFTFHTIRMADFLSLSPKNQKDKLTDGTVKPYSNGLGAFGLPGDFSSSSRFVRAAFVRKNLLSVSDFYRETSKQPTSQIDDFFSLMSSVSLPFGLSFGEDDMPMQTIYTVCADPNGLNYYFTDFTCRRVRRVKFGEEHFSMKTIALYQIYSSEDVKALN